MTRKILSSDRSYLPLVFAIFILLMFVYYLWFRVSSLEHNLKPHAQPQLKQDNVGRCTSDTFSDPYIPPIRCDGGSLDRGSSLGRGGCTTTIPINIPTQHTNMNYSQVGIITKQLANKNEILPLMGRRTITTRDKWQYYTVSGGGAGGNLQAKLPLKVNGRNCSGEYGCQEISNGDEVYVEGYQENFRATIYENGLFSYIPN
jgi:hypothetical protein